MMLYMLDTNIASHVIKGDIAEVRERLIAVPMHSVTISAVTQAELFYGLAKRSYPKGLSLRVHEFMLRVRVLDWDRDAAVSYSQLRVICERSGVALSPLDYMIAAHALSSGAVLVTRDKAFGRVPDGLAVEEW
ncbi:type II toxin-antitoxin system VapC family toxin [Prosthecochloris sp. HL-130-GSB]|jgi:tRNA(fMet)-specific endonuclease VapC|uniref:type II toxin-antitoxin system VapC family toxin n=1 Tax=Prosthecochloris sp. HL-130-GSB TaxID=1974213 RepID=UPI000A1C0D26|nr:VapC toxin family PIN domain ribonuclease [Prosthecochloris sp. HL-130-GSB]